MLNIHIFCSLLTDQLASLCNRMGILTAGIAIRGGKTAPLRASV